MAARWLGTCWVALFAVATGPAWAILDWSPAGCRPGLNPAYFGLCSLQEAWGIVVEALAVLGLLLTGLLALALMVCGWKRRREGWKAQLGLRLLLAVGTWGLFALVFAFVVRPNPPNCVARRFLFGTLFALCFASLAAQAGRLARLARAGVAPSGRATLLVALGLFLLECLINAEWLIVSTVRGRPLTRQPGQNPCSIAKKDFVGSLVYVMALLAGGLVLAAVGLCCRGRWAKRRAGCLLAASCLSAAIWVAWVAVYLRWERRPELRPKWPWYLTRDAWDDPPLAVALVANAWVFVLCCLVPWLVEVNRDQEEDEEEEEEEIREGLQKANTIRAYAENKAFDPRDGLGKNFRSPYQDIKPATNDLDPSSLNQEPRASTGSNALYRTHFA